LGCGTCVSANTTWRRRPRLRDDSHTTFLTIKRSRPFWRPTRRAHNTAID